LPDISAVLLIWRLIFLYVDEVSIVSRLAVFLYFYNGTAVVHVVQSAVFPAKVVSPSVCASVCFVNLSVRVVGVTWKLIRAYKSN